MSAKYVITGIDTGVGKTVVSAILAEALKATYWKPIQAGDLENSDSLKIKELTSHVRVLEEGFKLTEPMSPHAAAEIDGVSIDKIDLSIPHVEGNLIIEGAGGLMVPINSFGLTYADVFESWGLPVVIVSKHYLGSINHTLMTVDLLKRRNIKIAGIVFVGDENESTESIILKNGGVKMIARIPMIDVVDAAFVSKQAKSTQFAYFL